MAPPHHRRHSQQRHSNELEDAPSFGAWLRQRRRALDLTQAELAQRVGCARITIRRIEADELKPSQQLAELFAEHLGVPPAERKRWLQFARGLPVTQSTTPHPPILPKTQIEQHAKSQPDVQATPHLLSPHPPENRMVTILCVGFDSMATTQEEYAPEVMAHRMQWLLQCLEKILKPYASDGDPQVDRLLSNGVIILFGARQIHEDDPERALRTALGIRQNAQDAGFSISAGIHTGTVYRGAIESSLVTTVASVGQAISLTEAMQSHAAPAQILVSEAIYQQTSASFLFTPQTTPLLNVLGLTVYAVSDLQLHGQKTRGLPNRYTSLIGRSAEMSKLTDALTTLQRGQGSLIFVTGEAGVGKSRLLAELKDSKAQHLPSTFLWLEGRCQELGMSTAYWPVLDLLRTYFAGQGKPHPTATELAAQIMRVFDQLTGDGVLSLAQKEEIGPLLGNLFAVQFGNAWDEWLRHADPAQIRHRTAIALRDFFVALADHQPLVLLFDDLHWGDELSLHLITLLMEALAQHPLLLVCIYRSDEESVVARLPTLAVRKCPEQLIELQLRELPPSQSRMLVAELFAGAPIDPTLQQLLLEKAQGNPLFIEEMIRAMLDAEVLYWAGDGWKLSAPSSTIDVPRTVQGVILSRVDRLKPAVRSMIQRASVLGRLFQRRLLTQMSPADTDLNWLVETLLLKDLIYQERALPEVEYSFKHVLVQEAIYRSLLRTQREAFHQQAAEVIEALYAGNLVEVYELLAYHYERSTMGSKAILYLLKAGEKARVTYLNDAAIDYFQQALTKLKMPFSVSSPSFIESQMVEGLIGLGKAYLAASKIGEAEECFRQAITLSLQHKLASAQLVRFYYWLGETLSWQNRHTERLSVGQTALALLGDDSSSTEAALVNDTIAWSYWHLGQVEQAVEAALRTTTFLPSLPYTEELGGIYMHIAYITLRGQNQFATGLHWSRLARDKATQARDLRMLAVTYFFTAAEIWENSGDLVSATRDMQQAIQGFAKIGDTKREITALSRLAWILIRRGQLQNAEHCLLEADYKERQLGRLGAIGMGHANLGLIHLCRCEWKAVETNLFDSLADGQKNNFPAMHSVWINFLLGHIYLLQNRLQAAQQQLEQALSLLETVEIQGLPEAKADNYMRLLSTCEKAWGDSNKLHCAAQLIQHKDRKELDARFVQPFLQPCQTNSAFAQLDFSFSVDVPNAGTEKSSSTTWQWCDPLGDCTCEDRDGITIYAANAHHLYRNNRSAPRLLRTVCGDFAAQTICTPVSSMQPAIGGLLLWQDERNYLYLNKGLLGADEISFRGCIAGQNVMVGRGCLVTERAYLRFEQSGGWVRAMCSANGSEWLTAGQVEFPVKESFQIGLHALGDIDRWFYPGDYPNGTAIRFVEFVLYKRQ